jgi:hypothetical protein
MYMQSSFNILLSRCKVESQIFFHVKYIHVYMVMADADFLPARYRNTLAGMHWLRGCGLYRMLTGILGPTFGVRIEIPISLDKISLEVVRDGSWN